MRFLGKYVDGKTAVEYQYLAAKLTNSFSAHLFHVRDDTFIEFISDPSSPARLLNHSCEPNCVALCLPARFGRPVRHVVILAWRDIYSGEEITVNYRAFEPLEVCTCGSPSCKRIF
eukprot:Selendium_serpulae@DN338_c0_g1_i1.p2